MTAPRVWLVTGASSGFGLEMTRYALSQGEKVVATLRVPSAFAALSAEYPSSQLLVVRLDVTQPHEIKAAFQHAKAAFGRVDVVFNNAGYMVAGECESTPEEIARRMFEVNFWGAAHISQEAVRFFREENVPQGGHLVQNSAVVGLTAFPTVGFYGAAKHALEGLTEAFIKEVNPAWNIKFTAVEPGGFTTELVQNLHVAPQNLAYDWPGSHVSRIRKTFVEGHKKDTLTRFGYGDTAKGVRKIFEVTKVPSPPAHIPLGLDAITFIREYIGDLKRDVETYAPWSENLKSED